MILRQPPRVNSYIVLISLRSLKTLKEGRNLTNRQLLNSIAGKQAKTERILPKFGKYQSEPIAISPTESKWWKRLKPLAIFLLIQSIPISIGAFVYKRLLNAKIELLNTILEEPKDILTHSLKSIKSASACFLITSEVDTILIDPLWPGEELSLEKLLKGGESKKELEIVFPIPTNSTLTSKLNKQITLLYHNTSKSSTVQLIGVPEKIDNTPHWKNSWYSNITPPEFELYRLQPIKITTNLTGCGQRDWQQYSILKEGEDWIIAKN